MIASAGVQVRFCSDCRTGTSYLKSVLDELPDCGCTEQRISGGRLWTPKSALDNWEIGNASELGRLAIAGLLDRAHFRLNERSDYCNSYAKSAVTQALVSIVMPEKESILSSARNMRIRSSVPLPPGRIRHLCMLFPVQDKRRRLELQSRVGSCDQPWQLLLHIRSTVNLRQNRARDQLGL